MIFGRKKKRKLAEEDILDENELLADEAAEDEDEVEPDDLDEDADDAEDDDTDDDLEDDDGEDDDDDAEDEDEEDDLADDDLREDGPFDLEEVDLDADEIERLDFGCVILTPFENMQIQLQVDQSTNQVQSALVMYEQSALEVALFAAPSRTSMVKEITEDMSTQTTAAGGEVEINDGPFGPEIRRVIPVQGEDGQQAYHVSRTWFAQGPRWLLRGVLMGEAALTEGFEDAGELLFEFFCNVVVRRGNDPMVPGDLIPMTLPEGIAPQAGPSEE